MAGLGTYDSYAGYYAQLVNDQTPPESAFLREFYHVLFAYYQQNGLYTYLNEQLQGTKSTDTALKPIRNPAWRVVEFYAAKMFPGTLPDALPIQAPNERIIEPVHQLWEWSNFSSLKQRWARWFAIYGDWYIKLNTKREEEQIVSVFMSLIKPEYVNDMEVDERGFLTWIRIDVPQFDEDGEHTTSYTEIWSKEQQTVQVWEDHDAGLDADLENLPNPDSTTSFEDTHGENFIPIVYQPFRDDGGGRGGGAYSAQLDKIDEVNRQATRLAQILFRYNRALWVAITTGTDQLGRPMPPVDFSELVDSADVLTMKDDDIMPMPAASDLKPLVPDINYADALAVLQDQMGELTKDLPELAYYDLRDMGELSGRAVRFLLDDMISRVVEVRGNAESALVRAHQMGLTIGQNVGVFENVGDFVEGELRHQFEERPILPEDRGATAEVVQTFASAGASLFAAARAAGMSEQEAQDLASVDLFGLEGAPAERAAGTPQAPTGEAAGEAEEPPSEVT